MLPNTQQPTPRHVTIVVRPVDERCNLSCTYCNAQVYDGTGVMDDAVLSRMTRQAGAANGVSIDFCWHGGEPLLAGIDFYRRAFGYQDQYFGEAGKRAHNIIQSNGLLLTPEFIELLTARDVSLGFSLDGPDLDANRYRFRPKPGPRQFDQTLRMMRLVKDAGMRLTVIMVVHDGNVHRARETYEFFRDLEVDTLSFNPRFLRGDDLLSRGNVAPDDYASFIGEMIQLREADRQAGRRIYYLGVADQFRAAGLGQRASMCFLNNQCHRFINVNSGGECYATCSDFVGVPLGTLDQPGLTYILERLTAAPLRAVQKQLGHQDHHGAGPGCPKYSNGSGDIYLKPLLQVTSARS